MTRTALVCACVAMFGIGLVSTSAQTPAAPPAQAQLPTSTAAEVNGFYTNIAGFIAKSAAMVPADKFTWQPTPDVRSYARLFAHITDDNNGACAGIAGVAAIPRVDFTGRRTRSDISSRSDPASDQRPAGAGAYGSDQSLLFQRSGCAGSSAGHWDPGAAVCSRGAFRRSPHE